MAIVKHQVSRIGRSKRCSTSLLALLPVVAAMALADAASAADATASTGIEEVVITAQHRAQSDKEVAEAVSTIKPDNLDEIFAGGADITALNARVPSLYASSSYGRTYPVFSIRGFGDADFDYNAQQPVSVIYDGVVLQNPILKAFPVFDSVGLEVAKGPQGTLYGTDTPGGVIKIDSVKPTDKFEGYGDLSYGSWNTVAFNGAVNVPIVAGKLAMRVSLMDEHRDDWVHNDYAPNTRAQNVNGYDDMAGRVQFLWTPGDDTSVLLNMHARNMFGTSTLFRANAIDPGSNNLVANFQPNHMAFDDLYTQKLETRGASLTVDHDFGLIKLTSITGWESGKILSRGDLDGGWALANGSGNVDFESASQDVIPGLNQYTQELRLSNDPNSRLFNQGGVFVFHDLYQDYTYQYDDNHDALGAVQDNPLGELLNTRQNAVSWGIFDSASYKVIDSVTVSAGIRWSHDYKNLVIERYFAQGGESFLDGSTSDDTKNTGYHKNTARVSSSLASWDMGATWAVTDNVSTYARIARGGKGPAIEARDTFANNISTAKQEVTTSYEAGVKTDFFDKRLKLNADLYYWNDRDAQITATGGATNLILLQNADHVVGKGAELEATVKPFSNLLINAGGAYNYTEIHDPNLFSSACGDGCALLSPLDPKTGLAVLNGARLQDAPRWTGNVSARYNVPLNTDSALFAFTDWTYRSSVLTTAYSSIESNVKPQAIGGLRIGYENYAQELEVSAFSKNITNNVQAIGVAIDFVSGKYGKNAYINDPRTFGVEIKKRF